MKISTQRLALCALSTALICILAPFSVPMPGGVPLSLATLAVMFAGCLLGPRWGTLSVFLYLLLGAVGIPVFSGFTGSFAHIAGPTGGYLVGYLALAFVCGLFARVLSRGKSRAAQLGFLILGMVLGTVVLYLIGTIWFCAVTHTGFFAALALCVLPFLIGDALKMLVIVLLVPQTVRILEKAVPDLF